ncbi:unnamed protein product [Peniophora sp. CBMAI 1063]|nr:unnamed protein product [Peniophora sp. CBMAI 1063]
MDSITPLPERLLFSAVRTVTVFVRDLRALDWVLLGVIAALILPVPIYQKVTVRCLRMLLVLLAGLFTLVNIYVLAASWIPDSVSPEDSTIALVDISNFLTPIIADSVLLYNTILDNVAQGMACQDLVVASAAPLILKLGRLLDSQPLVQDRFRVVLDRIDEGGRYYSFIGGPPRLELTPKQSQEIGTGMQLFDNVYTFFYFVKSVRHERAVARVEGPLYIPRTALASLPPRTLILLSFTNFIAPITLSAAQLAALLRSTAEDDMLPFYLAVCKALIQILGALATSLFASLQRRRNDKMRGLVSLRLEGDDSDSALLAVSPRHIEDPSSPQTQIDVRRLARAGHTRRSSRYSTSASASGSGYGRPYQHHQWMSYSRAFQEYPEDSLWHESGY